MIPLTPEHREYKEKTLNHLLANLPVLEAQLSLESRAGAARSLENQIADIQAHINRLQIELAEGVAGESEADEFCRRVARALSKNKYHLARRYVNKLEAIEPFYPGLDRLKKEAEDERASRRTRSIAQGTALPYGAAIFSAGLAEGVAVRQPASPAEPHVEAGEAEEEGGFLRFFQFHIVVSCLVVSLIACVMTGMGGITVLRWLIEGN